MSVEQDAKNTRRINLGWVRVFVVGVLVLVVVAAVVGQWVLFSIGDVRGVLGSSLWLSDIVSPLTALALAVFGGLVVLRGEPRLYGWLMLATGFLLAVFGFTGPYARYAYETGGPFVSAASWIQDPWLVVWMCSFLLLPALFPDGRPASPRWRIPIISAAAVWVLLIVIFMIADRPMSNWFEDFDDALVNPTGFLPIPAIVYQATWLLVSLASFGISLGSLVTRWRLADRELRQQMKTVLIAFGAVLALFTLNLVSHVLPISGVDLAVGGVLDVMAAAAFVALAVALGLAVLRYRLYEVDLVINRSIVYGALTLGVIAMYVAVVVGVGAILPIGETTLALVATGIAAVAFAPLRDRLQHSVNRRMFGQRDDPYAVLAGMGRLMTETGTPEETLQTLTETVVRSLKLPGAAIELEEEGTWTTRATYGDVSPDNGVVVPLRHGDEVVGRLVVMSRSRHESLTSKDMALLEDIAHPAGAIAQSVRVSKVLQRSRERLVMAREEERRRIRRDLHDGLGPTLASQTFQLDEILEMIHADPERAVALVEELKRQNQQLMADIRTLVYELRPPTLDELGVAGAIRAQVGQFERSSDLGIEVTTMPDPLPALPAAVEVAAYRITREAIMNTIRHAAATRCAARLEAGADTLTISISDDGKGLSRSPRPGVGLISMRERCEELGGTFEARSMGRTGTEIVATLPILNGASGD